MDFWSAQDLNQESKRVIMPNSQKFWHKVIFEIRREFHSQVIKVLVFILEYSIIKHRTVGIYSAARTFRAIILCAVSCASQEKHVSKFHCTLSACICII